MSSSQALGADEWYAQFLSCFPITIHHAHDNGCLAAGSSGLELMLTPRSGTGCLGGRRVTWDMRWHEYAMVQAITVTESGYTYNYINLNSDPIRVGTFVFRHLYGI